MYSKGKNNSYNGHHQEMEGYLRKFKNFLRQIEYLAIKIESQSQQRTYNNNCRHNHNNNKDFLLIQFRIIYIKIRINLNNHNKCNYNKVIHLELKIFRKL